MQHRYTLEPYKTPRSRYTCPSCGQHKKFTRYIDTETNAHLAGHVGKCDREDSCGYHFTPRQYFAENPDVRSAHSDHVAYRPAIIKPDTIPDALFRKTLQHYHRNNFVQYLFALFEKEKVYRLIADYHIGTAKRWPKATIFWQVDCRQQVRTGKVMLYDALTGKRVKEPFAHISWVHTLLNPPVNSRTYNLRQCLFGEHLLGYHPHKIVAIVESEKTAVIAAGFMPRYCWLAAGSLNGLTYQKCRVLKERQVMLFPDVNGIEKWEARMKELRVQLPGTRFALSRYTDLPIPAENITPGSDLADWLTGV